MNLNPFKPFAIYLRPYRRRIVLGLGLLAFAQGMGALIPLVMKWAVDTAKAGFDAHGGQTTTINPITDTLAGDVVFYSAAILVLALAQMGLQIGMRWCFYSTARLVEYDIRRIYFHRLLRLSLSYFQRTRTGDLMARATNDLRAVQMFLGFGLRMLCDATVALVLSLALMCTIDWSLALYALLPMSVLTLVMNRVAVRVHQGFRQVQENFSSISARVQENLTGIRVVKAYVQREAEIENFRRLNRAYLEKNRILINIQSLFFPFMFLISGVSLALILWIGGHRILTGELTLGGLVAFNAYLARLTFPMISLGWMIDHYQRGMASMKRINAVLEERPEIDDAATAVAPATIRGDIQFRRLSFAYNGIPVLKEINLHIPAGTTLAVVGRVGSGKTTLARLIPRLIQAGPGQLLIDAIPVEQIPLQTLRAAIGYVPQNTFLFSDTVAENVALGNRETGKEEVLWATELAQLTKDLAEFPHGLDTLIGERGVTLSGGQKQRTALARAIIRRPRILILDDAMASVDTHTEQEILQRLRGEMARRTTILIAHRISTVKDADQIIVLDDGAIVEQGTHDELVAQDGIYAEMYRQQQLTRELSEL